MRRAAPPNSTESFDKVILLDTGGYDTKAILATFVLCHPVPVASDAKMLASSTIGGIILGWLTMLCPVDLDGRGKMHRPTFPPVSIVVVTHVWITAIRHARLQFQLAPSV